MAGEQRRIKADVLGVRLADIGDALCGQSRADLAALPRSLRAVLLPAILRASFAAHSELSNEIALPETDASSVFRLVRGHIRRLPAPIGRGPNRDGFCGSSEPALQRLSFPADSQSS